MNPQIKGLVLATAALLVAGCTPLPVRTMTAPNARLTGYSTYRFLDAPRLAFGTATDANDPMLGGSAANRLLRERIAATLEARGYVADEHAADIAVAFYAAVRPDVDVTRWSYGYPFIPDWPRWPVPPLPSATEGRIIVDVVDPGTKAILWRGEATTRLTGDVDANLRSVADLAASVVERVPIAARRRALASSR